MTSNQVLAEILNDTFKYYRTANDAHRANTYERATAVVKDWPTTITSGKELKDVRGVGKALMNDIDQALATGTTERLEKLREKFGDRIGIVEDFMKIHGVGKVKANMLYDQGYRSVEDLVPHLDDFTEAQRWGILYYYHFNQRIPRDEIDMIQWIIDAALKKKWPNLVWMVTGSYRRGEVNSGDIDIFVRQDDLSITIDSILEVLDRTGMLIGRLAAGPHKFMGIWQVSQAHWARRLDILISPKNEWPFATLYFTGSKELNVLMRSRAESLGWTLNEKRLMNMVTGEMYSADSEEQIFALLGIKYIQPTERFRTITTLPLIE